MIGFHEYLTKSDHDDPKGNGMSQTAGMQGERLDAIRSHLYAHGFSTIQSLADSVGASLATIRRDLQALEEAGKRTWAPETMTFWNFIATSKRGICPMVRWKDVRSESVGTQEE